MAESGAKHPGVALLGDGRGLAAGEVGGFAALALGHGDHDGAREHRAKNGKHIVVHGFLRQALGHAGVALGVFGGVADLASHDATGGIDLFDGQLNAVFEHHPGGGARARHLHDVGELDVLGLRSGGGQCQQRGQSQVKGLAWFHHHLQGWWHWGRGSKVFSRCTGPQRIRLDQNISLHCK